MIRIAAVLGDYYHPSEWAKDSLERSLNPDSTKVDIKINYYPHEQLREALSDQPDAVILFKENRLNPKEEKVELWMTEEIELEITRYVANGGSWLAWHSGLASYPAESLYTKMVKGYFLYHPEKHQPVHYKSVTENSITPHPVSFEVVDEHYFVHCDEEDTNIFLVSESIDGKAAAGWCHSYKNGKVCCLTPAHNKEGLLDSEFLSLLGRCVNWLILK